MRYTNDTKPEHIAFDSAKYPNHEALFADIARVMQILTDNDYICVFYYEDSGVYVLEFNYADDDMGTALPCWMLLDDYEDFIATKELPFNGEDD